MDISSIQYEMFIFALGMKCLNRENFMVSRFIFMFEYPARVSGRTIITIKHCGSIILAVVVIWGRVGPKFPPHVGGKQVSEPQT